MLQEAPAKIVTSLGAERHGRGRLPETSGRFDRITTDKEFMEFLTLPGYGRLD